jgi:hypothetical protein
MELIEGVDFAKWVKSLYFWVLQTIKRSDDAKGFTLLPKRWVVERTWGRLNWYRRLAKDYEILPETIDLLLIEVIAGEQKIDVHADIYLNCCPDISAKISEGRASTD